MLIEHDMMKLNASRMSVEGGCQPGEDEAREKVEYRVSYQKAENRPYLEQEDWLGVARPEIESERFAVPNRERARNEVNIRRQGGATIHTCTSSSRVSVQS